ncbi:MAG: ribonucleoside-diphosphate reductase subunit alpha [Rhodobacteraceae bacterium]|nr:ribonucleoside-diphosphate reductase subunit alpha [Paracoccaceae bacterium]|tara:strand:- start:1859 stop:4633 length:2775 start_codon:yes stop_codon:yes gene_type:complete
MAMEEQVIKRNGEKENMSFDKIARRTMLLGKNELNINYSSLSKKIIERLYDGISTSIIDELTAQQCASLSTTHTDYGILASRILVSNHQKNTEDDYLSVVSQLYDYIDGNGKHSPLVSKKFNDFVVKNCEIINSWFDYSRDYLIDYFGFKTLERAYLMRTNKIMVERPQHMWMRVAIAIWMDSPDWKIKIKETYDLMSKKYFTHATPTLFNAGTKRQQMSSCYLLAMEDDSIQGIFNTLTDCAKISKWAGGIGLHIHNVRAKGTQIRGTNGTSNGIVPMLRCFNSTARYVDQGGGKRAGSFAVYIEPWHGDIESFLDMKKNHGDEDQRARDLFYALWIPDLFMERVKNDKKWTLMCPDKSPGLSDVYGENFKKLYEQYEDEGRGISVVKARDIWYKILDSQIETGTPYMLYKNACNMKSNQQNLGTIKSSNLCTEIIEYSDENETAVCNLASIGLSNFVKPKDHKISEITMYTKADCVYCKLAKQLCNNKNIKYKEIHCDNDEFRKQTYIKLSKNFKKEINSVPQIINTSQSNEQILIGGYKQLNNFVSDVFDYEKLHEVTKIITRNLNSIIDKNFYPTDKTKRSNMLHRPVGIGVQGLADTYAKMNIEFHSEKAKNINKYIFETIYHGALESSMEISKERHLKMAKLLPSYKNKFWTFKNSNPECDTYMLQHLQDETIMNELRKIKPIYNEIKNLDEVRLGCYSSFEGSPTSKGILQFDMWGVTPSDRYDWNKLKRNIRIHGLRNSLLVAPMPTASTSQILGNNECFEPFTSNIYVRRTLAGEFIMINKYLLKELIDLNLWNEDMKNQIIKDGGSIQNIKSIPSVLRKKYKIVWEIPMKHILEMAADRGAFICQSQSTNLWMKNPTYKNLTAMHLFAWKKGLKTGIYYLRTKAKAAPQQFTIEPGKKQDVQQEEDDDCLMCGS